MLVTNRMSPAQRTTSGACARRARGLGAAARHVAVDLTPQAVEQIAIRVTQLLRHERPHVRADSAPVWMTAKELARHLKLNPAWIYEHAQELGAIRTGKGPKARMRFNLETATEALREHQKTPGPTGEARTTRTRARVVPSAYPLDAPLLKVRDPYARGVRRRLYSRPRAGGVR